MTSRRRRPRPAALLAAALALAAPAAQPQPQAETAAAPLRLMSWSAGAGTAWTPLFFAVDLPGYVDSAGRVLREVRATRPNERMRALAAQVAQAKPALLAVQALGRWSTGPLTMHGLRCGTMKVEIDMLAALLRALRAQGTPYRVAVQAPQFELPPLPARPAPGELRCVVAGERLAILARADLPRGSTSNPQWGRLDAPTPPPALPAASGTAQVGVWPGGRAWASVDVHWAGGALRFMSAQLTRLDPFTPDGRRQDGELLRVLAEAGALPVALALTGNGTATAAPPPPHALHADFLAAGWRDAWAQAQPQQPGATCCHAPAMDDAPSLLSRRTDVFWLRGPLRATTATVVDAAPGEDGAPAAGLWPSDHAGVAVELEAAPVPPAPRWARGRRSQAPRVSPPPGCRPAAVRRGAARGRGAGLKPAPWGPCGPATSRCPRSPRPSTRPC